MRPADEHVAAVLLAAGKGTRMGSSLPKMTFALFGRPLVSYPAAALRNAGIHRIIAVVGHAAEEVRAALGPEIDYAVQKEQKGTGHALLTARSLLQGFRGDLVVTVGDAPLLTSETIRKILDHRRRTGAAAVLLTAVFDDEVPPYGRIVRDEDGRVVRIVEERDASREQRRIREVNASVYCFDAGRVLPLLDEIDPQNQAGEYYLTDIVEILLRHGHEVEAVKAEDSRTVLGVNTREDLVRVFRVMRDRIVKAHLAAGVTILDPESTLIDDTVRIGEETVIYPFTVLQEGTVIGKGCTVGPFVKLSNSRIAPGCEIEFVVLCDAVISTPGSRIVSEGIPPAQIRKLTAEARAESLEGSSTEG